ncbi:hypothetical protein AB0H73_10125 [Streptomyces olivoreticuli]
MPNNTVTTTGTPAPLLCTLAPAPADPTLIHLHRAGTTTTLCGIAVPDGRIPAPLRLDELCAACHDNSST